ncbi:MAG: YkgJ family cysteine cluster protein [Flavobacteriales bacterium]|nr:YkgJ family cysteine cluster protein [Flavobacteriales bacterium]
MNPWELACLAKEKQIPVQTFSELYCDFGGILLRFDGKKDKNGFPACSQYIDGFGCSVHQGRSLACRLFPLGRQIQNGEANYIYEGTSFPCLNGCPEVLNLPRLSVRKYLIGQETSIFEKAQDAYLEVVQNLADIAFELLLDTGLVGTGETKTLQTWRKLGSTSPNNLALQIGKEWLDALLFPDFDCNRENVIEFISQHNEKLQQLAQDKFAELNNFDEIQAASVQMMRIALYLAKAVGANPEILAEYWVEIAKENGACE